MRRVIVPVLALFSAAAKGDAGRTSSQTTLPREVVVRVMASIRPQLAACYAEYRVVGVATVNLTIAPSGSVTAAIAPAVGGWGDFSKASPTALCIVDAVQSAHFPAFDGVAQKIAYPVVLGDSADAGAASKESDALRRAQQAYTAGKYVDAIALARAATSDNPQRTGRIIGASSCFLKDVQAATTAWKALDDAGRRFVAYVCANNGVRIDER